MEAIPARKIVTKKGRGYVPEVLRHFQFFEHITPPNTRVIATLNFYLAANSVKPPFRG